MPIAVLYDIHGNLPAPEAVLKDVRNAVVDQVLVGEDILPGPMSCDLLAVLIALDLPVRFILGNGDREVLAMANGEEPTSVPEQYLPAMRWEAGRLNSRHPRWMARWPGSVRLEIGGLGEVMFCHATPQSDTDIFTKRTPEERLRPLFEGARADIVGCGHTHMQLDRMVGSTRIVNAGSVGMPFGEPGTSVASGSCNESSNA